MLTSVVVLVVVFGALGTVGFVIFAGLRRVPDRKIGLVYRRFGHDPRDTFRVRLYGSMGPQADVLLPNSRRWLWPFLYEVRTVGQTHVPDGTIGLVEARDGKVRPPGRRLGQYIEDCQYFQDARAFLLGGGEQGRQLGYLPGGAYYNINTELFHVITVDTVNPSRDHGLAAEQLREVEIPVGRTGVVITSDGRPPDAESNAVGRAVAGHNNFRLPWVFLGRGGQRGVQAETLEPGTYGINPWLARVVQIPTRDLYLEWTKRSEKRPGRFDSALDQIMVNVQGYRISIEMSQVIRIPPDSAPLLVQRMGEGVDGATGYEHPLQRFVQRELQGAVAGHFTEIIGKYRVMEFIVDYNKLKLQLQDKVVHALKEWGVVAGETILREFDPEDRELDQLRRVLGGQDIELKKLVRQRELIEKTAENREIQAKIDRIDIDLKGEEDIVKLRKQVEILGPYHVVLERALGHLSKMNVPKVVGGDSAERLLAAMPYTYAQDLLKELVKNYDGREEPAKRVEPVEEAEEAEEITDAPAPDPDDEMWR